VGTVVTFEIDVGARGEDDQMTDLTAARVRGMLAIALDTPDLRTALRVVEQVAPSMGIAKIGLELFGAVGPAAVRAIRDIGVEVFVDLKLHDIPTTVHRAAAAIGSLGIGYATIHAAGGVDMLRAGVRGLTEGAEHAGHAAPTTLGVTVLTSDHADEGLLRARVRTVLEAGCPGVICAATDLGVVREIAPDVLAVTPGIRPAGSRSDDQVRVTTPADAVARGAGMLVIGRPVSAAPDPGAAAAAIAASILRS
jgi:orotidine-5'-phosphate decarboxylase